MSLFFSGRKWRWNNSNVNYESWCRLPWSHCGHCKLKLTVVCCTAQWEANQTLANFHFSRLTLWPTTWLKKSPPSLFTFTKVFSCAPRNTFLFIKSDVRNTFLVTTAKTRPRRLVVSPPRPAGKIIVLNNKRLPTPHEQKPFVKPSKLPVRFQKIVYYKAVQIFQSDFRGRSSIVFVNQKDVMPNCFWNPAMLQK